MASCKPEIIRVSLTPPAPAEGALWIAEEREIKVGIEGTDIITTRKLTGYYPIHKEEMRTIIKALKRKEENRAKAREKLKQDQAPKTKP